MPAPLELIVVLAIVLALIGPGKLGRLGATYRLSIQAFRDGIAGKTPVRRCVNCLGAIPPAARFCPGCGLRATRVAIDT